MIDKWKNEQRTLQVDDLVKLVDDNLPHGQWLLGQFTELQPSADGRIRSAKVKTNQGTYKLPLTSFQLCLKKDWNKCWGLARGWCIRLETVLFNAVLDYLHVFIYHACCYMLGLFQCSFIHVFNSMPLLYITAFVFSHLTLAISLCCSVIHD